MKTWRNLFATQLIFDARECLDRTSGELWIYRVPLSRFITMAENKRALEAERSEKDQLLARKCTLKDQISQFELIIREAERLSQQRQNETAKQIERVQAEAQVETVRVCTEWYEEDKRGAVTDLVCNKIFLTIGLPDAELSLLVDATQSGQTYDELNAAKSGLASASSDLQIIELYGMSPEDHYAQELEKSAQGTSKEPEADECAEFR